MPVSAVPTTSMIGQSELSIFKKSDFRQKGGIKILPKQFVFLFSGWKASNIHAQSRHRKPCSWCRRWSPPPAPRRHPVHHHWQPRVLPKPQVWKAQKGLDLRFQAIKKRNLATIWCAKNEGIPATFEKEQKKMK